jgi:hypothetical protein
MLPQRNPHEVSWPEMAEKLAVESRRVRNLTYCRVGCKIAALRLTSVVDAFVARWQRRLHEIFAEGEN